MLCVIAKLDSHAAERLRALQRIANSYSLHPSPVYGHITIATYTPEDDRPFVAGCKELLRGTPPFPVLYDRVEVLSETSIIAAAPRENGALLSLHDRIAARYGAFLDAWTCDDGWYPHTTLLYAPQAELPRICRVMRDGFSPFEAVVKNIEFSRVTETGYEIVDRIVL